MGGTSRDSITKILTGVAVGSAAVSPLGTMAGITTTLVLTSQMLHASWAANVDRFCLLSSSTVYSPADYPVKEDDAWSGPTHQAYLGYGWAARYLEKLAEFVASRSDTKIALVRCTEVYGRWDNFDPASCHVIPALIRKAVEKQDPFEVWGSGEEVRDFVHANDLAKGCLLTLEKHATCDPVNVAYGKAATIKEIAHMILKAAGYENANIKFDASRPTAVPIRMVDISKAKKILGFQPNVSLEKGLSDTVEWYSSTRTERV